LPAVPTTSRRVESSDNLIKVRPTVRVPKAPRRPPVLLVAAVALVALVLAGAWAAIAWTPAGQRVSPATFAVVLAGINQQQDRLLILEPGDYPGPWRFGAAHAGVTLRAAAPGVRVVATGIAAEVPLVRCEPGLSGFALHGIELRHPGGVALEAVAGARATVHAAVVGGGVVVSGASLALHGSTVHGSLVCDLHGTVSVQDSAIAAAPALDLRDGRVEVQRTRLSGSGEVALVRAVLGQLDLDAVVVEPAVPGVLGLDLHAGVTATLRDVAVRQVATGLRTDAAKLPAINGLSVSASDTGWWWRGAREAAWSWEAIHLDAPKPVHGIDLPLAGTGARAERLALVPGPSVGGR
jgi:hypothetical protein